MFADFTSLDFSLAFSAPLSPNTVPVRSSHPAYPRLWHALRSCGQNVHKLQGHGGASPVGISHSDGHAIFTLQMSVDRYIVAKKHALSRISKREEKKARAFLTTFGIDYDAISKEQFVNLIEVLKLSKHMKSPINQRGKASPYQSHGKGKKKRK